LAEVAGLQELDRIQKTAVATRSWRGKAICQKKKFKKIKKSDTFLW